MRRVALVSPYAWSVPGGVNRHVAGLAAQLRAAGDEVVVLAPGGGDVPLGGAVGLPFNGARSNLCLAPEAVLAARRALAAFRPDVVHLHEPVAPVVCWDLLGSSPAPLVGTFHTYSENEVPHAVANAAGARRRMNRLAVRIAVSDAAAWTGRRFWGGAYRVIPNGVDLPAAVRPQRPGQRLRLVFVGQAVERKGLPVLLRAFEALREHVDAELVVVGATREEAAPLLLETDRVTVVGRVGDAEKAALIRAADVLVAPSLGGESFGMVLTEAFAQGTPVVASDIAGYRDVVRSGQDGLLVPRGDAGALAGALRDLALDPARREAMGASARRSAERFAWPAVAAQVRAAHADAIAAPEPAGARRLAVAAGLRSIDAAGHERPRRLPSPDPPPAASPLRRTARRAALAVSGAGVLAAGWWAVQRIGLDAIAASLLGSRPAWVVVALAVMCLSMVLRAGAWHAILQAAAVPAGLGDALRGTSIGVLMSATLPARLGEPARAVLVARRTGRPRDQLPVVAGTLVSQTLLNLLALAILAVVSFGTIELFAERRGDLLLFALAPLALLLAVLLAPALLRGDGLRRLRATAGRLRHGLRVFRRPRLGARAFALQLAAWALQWLACYVLFAALGLQGVGMGAAAAILFAVNVTAVLPATPSNVGVFQAACMVVLTGAHGASAADALAYGIVLQAVEVATALLMGVPALLREGLSWREVRLRALSATPVELPPLPLAGGTAPG